MDEMVHHAVGRANGIGFALYRPLTQAMQLKEELEFTGRSLALYRKGLVP